MHHKENVERKIGWTGWTSYTSSSGLIATARWSWWRRFGHCRESQRLPSHPWCTNYGDVFCTAQNTCRMNWRGAPSLARWTENAGYVGLKIAMDFQYSSIWAAAFYFSIWRILHTWQTNEPLKKGLPGGATYLQPKKDRRQWRMSQYDCRGAGTLTTTTWLLKKSRVEHRWPARSSSRERRRRVQLYCREEEILALLPLSATSQNTNFHQS